MRRLYIAEKPSVGQALALELGITRREDGYLQCGADRVTWCFGHMLELAEPEAYLPAPRSKGRNGGRAWRAEDLPIVPERWQLRPKGRVKKQLALIGRLLQESTEVVHAGDPDREGQLLVDEVLEHFDNRLPVLRYWASAQDPASVARALRELKPNQDYAPLAEAARGRQRADWLIGINLSRWCTLRARAQGGQAVWAVGRVQTPTLAMVVARDREVEAFRPQVTYGVEAELVFAGQRFVGSWEPREGLERQDGGRAREMADGLVLAAAGAVGRVVELQREPQTLQVPLPLSLADLTVLASRLYGYGAQEVLDAAQALYAVHKLISYPRTDSPYLPRAQHTQAPQVLAALGAVEPGWQGLLALADPTLQSRAWDDSKVTAHHGIIPTAHGAARAGLGERERRVHDLVVQHYLLQFFPSHVRANTRLVIELAGQRFVAAGQVVTCQGFLEVLTRMQGPRRSGAALPELQEGAQVACSRASRKDMATKAPPRFTEGTLVRAMEQVQRWVADAGQRQVLREGDGLGTAATRAAVIGELKRRGYLKVQGSSLVSTAQGRALVAQVPAQIRSPVLTALFERVLRQVAAGQVQVEPFLAQQVAFVRLLIDGRQEGRDDAAVCEAGVEAGPSRTGVKKTG